MNLNATEGALWRRMLLGITYFFLLLPSAWAVDSDALYARGQWLRQQGDVRAAIEMLQQSRAIAENPGAAARASAGLAAALLQAQRLDDAQRVLDSALAQPIDAAERAALVLGQANIAAQRRQESAAHALYAQVIATAGASVTDVLVARLNQVRLLPPREQVAALEALRQRVLTIGPVGVRIALMLHVGEQAINLGPVGARTAYEALENARRESLGQAQLRAQVAALEGLARLYEAQGRRDEALHLGNDALQAAGRAPLRTVQDLLMAVEWRQARLWRLRGQADRALAAATRAVDHAQAIRPDLPIDTPQGRSTYQTVLQPLLELFVDLQTEALDGLSEPRQAVALERVREAVEAMRQSEMQDFLGDRCTVEEADAARLEPGALALYPLILADRVEILVQTRDGLRRVTRKVPRTQVVNAARDLARALRNGQENYLVPARQLYDWLVRPVEGLLAAHHTLVVVPDGALRLVPFAALDDGAQPLLRRIAVATVTGMSMTDAGRPARGRLNALIAGLANPGPVVEKISLSEVQRSAPAAVAARALPAAMAQRATRSAARALGAREAEAMREDLALPGVRDEVAAIAAITGGKVLLDADFTLGVFEGEARGGEYRIVHIASHGVFGGSADSSYLLAFDDLLGINRLQSVLQSEQVQQSPIDLLTLSACETADGNDRAPLGISGAAMRARARSVLGTLWPVDDEAARLLMESFYRGLSKDGQSKAAALRTAQLELLAQPVTRHPYYWAPFGLIGNWR